MRFLIAVFLLCCSLIAPAQLDTLQPKKLKVGIKEAPPFIIKNNDKKPQGVSTTLWENIAVEKNILFEYVWYESLEELLLDIENQEIDLSINPITVSESRMKTFEFSQPFFITHTVIAKKNKREWFTALKSLFSWDFWLAMLVLGTVLFIFGFLIWLLERKKNPEHFGGNRGLFDGFWWSAVTMTTVGYGDKAPKSVAGRLLAIVWMFAAIFIISGITASIASALTVHRIESEITHKNDLVKFHTGTVEGAPSEASMLQSGDSPQTFSTVEEGLEAIMENKIDLFIYDEPILRFAIRNKGLEEDINVLEIVLSRDYYSFTYPLNSELRHQINPTLVRILRGEEWNAVLKKFRL